jgi:hypothetical protein
MHDSLNAVLLKRLEDKVEIAKIPQYKLDILDRLTVALTQIIENYRLISFTHQHGCHITANITSSTTNQNPHQLVPF